MDITQKILSDITVYMKYARYLPEQNRRENWTELIDRNVEMHKKKYPELVDEIDKAYELVRQKKVLPSMRSLQFAGKSIEVSPNRVFNCLSRETKFITDKGVKSFENFKDGDSVKVLTHKGRWKNAIVRSYGKQSLNKLKFRRGRSQKIVYATDNHRWIDQNSNVTDNINVGTVLIPPKRNYDFDYHNSTPNERLYWCYGYVYGDGTRVKDNNGEYKYSMVRLCGSDVDYFKERFEEVGFKTTTSNSLHGDFIAFTGKYLKTLPDLEKDDPKLIKAFLDGYLSADAHKNPDWYRNHDLPRYKSIQTSNEESYDFLKKALCIAGYYTLNEQDYSREETNYGTRGFTRKISISNYIGSLSCTSWSLVEIEKNVKNEIVWCLEVESDHSFTLDSGIVTGNCAFLPVDDWRAFGEIMFLLLGGTGVGYSVQKHHIRQLPRINKPNPDQEKRYLIGDSIEGWADSIKILMKSYFFGGEKIRFDFSDIRPKGARLVTSGGKAPGPRPLRECLVKLEGILDETENGKRLEPIQVHDIVCHIADAVLAGGIRRAALISLFSATDDEMITCKTGNWWEKNPQRGRANNSAVLLRHRITKEYFFNLWKKIEESQSGEPAFYLTNDKDWGTNPCKPLDATILTPEGYITFEEALQRESLEVITPDGKVVEASAPFKTGENREVFEITLSNGLKLLGTDNHKHMLSDGSWVEVKDLEIGDHLKLGNFTKYQDFEVDNTEEYNKGLLNGWMLGDGWNFKRNDRKDSKRAGLCFGEQEFDVISTFEKITGTKAKPHYQKPETCAVLTVHQDTLDLEDKWELPFTKSKDYKIGFIKALFTVDGYISNRINSVQLYSINREMLEGVSLILQEFGIRSSVQIHNNAKSYVGEDGEIRNNKTCYKLNVYAGQYKRIGFLSKEKNDALEHQKDKGLYRRKDYETVVDIQLRSIEDVYDITVYDDSHAFIDSGIVTHNCCEIALRPYQFCNLTEVNVSNVESQEDLNERVKVASFIGTLQAGYTDFHYLRKIWKDTTEKDALIGVSMTGIGSNKLPDLDLHEASEIVKEENKRVANIIGINSAARTTTVKPAGTTSLVLGCSSGIHAWHNDYYIRRMRVGKNEAIYTYLHENHPELIEDEHFRPHDTAVISVPQRAPKGAIMRTESPIDLLERVRWVYEKWVKNGHINGHNTHNISATVSIKDDEWEQVGKWMWENRQCYNGLSVLPYNGGTYKQAPFEDCDEETFHRMIQTLMDVDLDNIYEEQDNTDLKGELACSADGCEVV